MHPLNFQGCGYRQGNRYYILPRRNSFPSLERVSETEAVK